MQWASRTPVGLLIVPLVPSEEAAGAVTLASVIVLLLNVYLCVLHIGEGDADHNHSTRIFVREVQPLPKLIHVL